MAVVSENFRALSTCRGHNVRNGDVDKRRAVRLIPTGINASRLRAWCWDRAMRVYLTFSTWAFSTEREPHSRFLQRDPLTDTTVRPGSPRSLSHPDGGTVSDPDYDTIELWLRKLGHRCVQSGDPAAASCDNIPSAGAHQPYRHRCDAKVYVDNVQIGGTTMSANQPNMISRAGFQFSSGGSRPQNGDVDQRCAVRHRCPGGRDIRTLPRV
jgi:hypothetical protein